MKIAVLSDVHGFSLALERVLEDIAKVQDVQRIIAAGDLCEVGPDPVGALELLEERGVELIKGNTDDDLANDERSSKSARWTMEQLGRDWLRFLDELPREIRVSAPGSNEPEMDLQVVHASPGSLYQGFDPEASEDEIREIIGETEAGMIAFGHIHIAYQRTVGSTRLIDVSAVGNPKDEDLRPRWALIEWDAESKSWLGEHQYVAYPLEETREQIQASGMPNPDKVLAKLIHASYRPMS